MTGSSTARLDRLRRRTAGSVRRRVATPYPVEWLKWPQPRPPFPAHTLGRVRFGLRQTTAARRDLPDYLVIGAAKAATTSLHEYLIAHPDVCAPLRKEIRYFDLHYEKGESWYRAHFPTRRGRARMERRSGVPPLVGEATPSYLPSPAAPQRIAAALPEARFVALLREPVDRAISHYSMRVRRGLETRSIEDALVEDSSYVTLGLYAQQLERWWQHVDPTRLLVVPTESLTVEPNRGFDRVLEFLGLRPWNPPDFTVHLAGRHEPAPASVRRHLAEMYRAPNEHLWAILGVDWGWNDRT